jgi:transcriptional regulator with XRE-family HTH domain
MLDHEVDLEALGRRAESLVENHQNLMRSLVAMRSKHHLTQADVADRMGVSQPTVASFERYDSNPTLSTIRRYALAVGAQIEERVIDDCVRNAQRRVAAASASSPRFRMLQPAALDYEWSGSSRLAEVLNG